MDYAKIYTKLIENAQNREEPKEYYELHHILPRCMGGENSDNNVVKLTLREHYFAHELLSEIYPNSKELSCALWMMTIMTVSALKRSNESHICITPRMNHFLEKEGKEIRISSREYNIAKAKYRDSKRGKIYSSEERKNVSNGTKKAMRKQEIIEKCIKGSAGCKFFRNKIDGSVHKWFPGDPEIDLNIYEWGRGKMSSEQKRKISDSNNLKKKYFIIPETNSKYTQYEDFVSKVPFDWVEKWTNESNRLLKKYITKAVRQFNIDTGFKYDNQIIFKVPGKSKNFNIITPSLYECCSDVMTNWRDFDISEKLTEKIKEKIEEIIELNKIYMKI